MDWIQFKIRLQFFFMEHKDKYILITSTTFKLSVLSLISGNGICVHYSFYSCGKLHRYRYIFREGYTTVPTYAYTEG